MTPDEFNAQEIAAGRLTPEMLAVALAAGGILAFQKANGLTPDGKAGVRTQAALAGRPIPVGQAAIEKVYGKFAYTEAQGGRIVIDPKWVDKNIATIRLHTGQNVRLHAMVAPEFASLFAKACKASSYTPASVQTFVPRHTLWDPKKSLSLHSWGIAIDFSPSENTMGGTDGKGGQSKLRQNLSFVKVFTDAGWTWGGSWKMKDDMHFQRAG